MTNFQICQVESVLWYLPLNASSVTYGIAFIVSWWIRIYTDIISLHISNHSEISLVSILKLFVDTFVSFLKREVIYYLLFEWEYSDFRFMDENSEDKKGKKGKKVVRLSNTILLIRNVFGKYHSGKRGLNYGSTTLKRTWNIMRKKMLVTSIFLSSFSWCLQKRLT